MTWPGAKNGDQPWERQSLGETNALQVSTLTLFAQAAWPSLLPDELPGLLPLLPLTSCCECTTKIVDRQVGTAFLAPMQPFTSQKQGVAWGCRSTAPGCQ